MYFPYFRGKQFELLTIYERSDIITDVGNIVPVVEPVNENFADLRRNIERYQEDSAPVILIENPGVGDLIGETERLHGEILSDFDDYDQLEVGVLVHANSSVDDINDCVERNPDRDVSVIHRHPIDERTDLIDLCRNTDNIARHIFVEGETGEAYRRAFEEFQRVLLEDGFQRQPRNADYPEESFFSDLHLRYGELDYEGFGDFLIVGDHYFARGGPAHAVAIHLISVGEDGQLITKHFVSDRTESPRDRGGKYLEALRKLVDEAEDDKVLGGTRAYTEFRQHLEEKQFRGLGYVKKLSMMHHLEVVNDLL